MLKDKILNGEELASDEVERLVKDNFNEEGIEIVEENNLCNVDDYDVMRTIVGIGNRYFELCWNSSKRYEDIFENQIAEELKRIEVTKYEYVPL